MTTPPNYDDILAGTRRKLTGQETRRETQPETPQRTAVQAVRQLAIRQPAASPDPVSAFSRPTPDFLEEETPLWRPAAKKENPASTSGVGGGLGLAEAARIGPPPSPRTQKAKAPAAPRLPFQNAQDFDAHELDAIDFGVTKSKPKAKPPAEIRKDAPHGSPLTPPSLGAAPPPPKFAAAGLGSALNHEAPRAEAEKDILQRQLDALVSGVADPAANPVAPLVQRASQRGEAADTAPAAAEETDHAAPPFRSASDDGERSDDPRSDGAGQNAEDDVASPPAPDAPPVPELADEEMSPAIWKATARQMQDYSALLDKLRKPPAEDDDGPSEADAARLKALRAWLEGRDWFAPEDGSDSALARAIDRAGFDRLAPFLRRRAVEAAATHFGWRAQGELAQDGLKSLLEVPADLLEVAGLLASVAAAPPEGGEPRSAELVRRFNDPKIGLENRMRALFALVERHGTGALAATTAGAESLWSGEDVAAILRRRAALREGFEDVAAELMAAAPEQLAGLPKEALDELAAARARAKEFDGLKGAYARGELTAAEYLRRHHRLTYEVSQDMARIGSLIGGLAQGAKKATVLAAKAARRLREAAARGGSAVKETADRIARGFDGDDFDDWGGAVPAGGPGRPLGGRPGEEAGPAPGVLERLDDNPGRGALQSPEALDAHPPRPMADMTPAQRRRRKRNQEAVKGKTLEAVVRERPAPTTGKEASEDRAFFRDIMPENESIPAAERAAKELDFEGGPTTRFEHAFDSLSDRDFDACWARSACREALKTRLRSPGGYHEHLMLEQTPHMRTNLGVTAGEIRGLDFRTKTGDLHLKDQKTGRIVTHRQGAEGGEAARISRQFHDELKKAIKRSTSRKELVENIHELAERWLPSGVADLPKGLGGQK